MSARQTSASQAQYAYMRSHARLLATCADYARYDATKAAWIAQHPDATPAEYQAAVRAIAKACGI
jgi:hypothetical protein